jgi:hypothetical protein
VDQEGLPYPKFELMHEVNHKGAEDIKIEVFESIRKCVLE